MKKLLLSSLLLTQSLFCNQTPQYRYSGQEALDHLEQTSECHHCDLSKQDLRDAIRQARYYNPEKTIDLSDSRLVRSDLSGADLSEANLSGAILCNAYLHWTNFYRANLSDANLKKASIYKTNFEEANTWNAIISKEDHEYLTWYQWLVLTQSKK
jgi:uncharacterized protein YjbI with pentapeptide repeats